MNAKEYLWLFKGIYKRIDDVLDRERLAIAIMQEIAKDTRMEIIKQEREQAKQEPATGRQIAYLKILGLTVNNRITKQKAAELIQMAVTNNRSSKIK